MAYWIVFQGSSWKRSRAGEYLWAPQRGKGDRGQAYWSSMTKVKAGDLILSGYNNALRAVSEVEKPAYVAYRPDPKDAQLWHGEGWRLDLKYTKLPKPMFYSDWVPAVMSEMPKVHSPFHTTGKPNQGFLYHLPNSVGEYVMQLAREQGMDLAYEAGKDIKVPEESVTSRLAVRAARSGQGKFRDDLDKHWEGACAVTGVTRREMLRASHIKPWSSSNNIERLDPANGLLLSVVYDAAFDATLISFDDSGAMILANDLSNAEAKALGVDPSARIVFRSDRTKKYMAEHRELLRAREKRVLV